MLQALIIFVRNPELGKVKTRLAATMGDEKALQIYSLLLQHTCAITRNHNADKYVFYTSTPVANDLWEQAGFFRLLQLEGGLGEKMKHAFETVFARRYEQVLIIGSDCINLTTEIIDRAFESLTTHDAVIGPANDGGYYLLGTKAVYPELFKNKEWSSAEVCRATLTDFEKLGLSFNVLPELIDIDTEEDWQEAQKLV